MDKYFFQEESSFVNVDQIYIPDDFSRVVEPDNLFGLDFKENMFEQPLMMASSFPSDQEQEQQSINQDSSCNSEATTVIPMTSSSLQYPPCRCHKIQCQKKYCECFRNGRKCSKKCICTDCCNQPRNTCLKVNVEQMWMVSYMFKKF